MILRFYWKIFLYFLSAFRLASVGALASDMHLWSKECCPLKVWGARNWSKSCWNLDSQDAKLYISRQCPVGKLRIKDTYLFKYSPLPSACPVGLHHIGESRRIDTTLQHMNCYCCTASFAQHVLDHGVANACAFDKDIKQGEHWNLERWQRIANGTDSTVADRVRRECDGLNETGSPLCLKMLFWTPREADPSSCTNHLSLLSRWN